MFKFDFQLEDTDDDFVVQPSGAVQSRLDDQLGLGGNEAGPSSSRQCHHVSLDELLSALPETISYSPLSHSSLSAPLLRRDLFDARFQLIHRSSINESADDAGSAPKTEEGAEYVDTATDLIPGLYEGGLKTWEGGVDLVEVLCTVRKGSEDSVGEWVSGGKVLEVGCGTALPTAFLLRSLLGRPSAEAPTTLHLQDFNLPVLQLVTLPNLLLAALPFIPPEALHSPEEAEDVEAVIPDLAEPGHLDISPTLIAAFKHLLAEKRVELRFTHGHWEGLAQELEGQETYGLVLTAETIYAEESNAALLSVLKNALGWRKGSEQPRQRHEEVQLEDSLGDLNVKDDWAKSPLREQREGFALVAAKVLYFGVGGGLQGFLQRVEEHDGSWTGVKEWIKGVGRKVVQVTF